MARRYVVRAVVGMVAAILVLGADPGVASARERENRCISPTGDNLNQTFDTDDGFVAPFCTRIISGEKWRPIVRIQVAGTERVFPDGYTPEHRNLVKDFLAKLVSTRYVVDAGTSQERTFVVTPDNLIIEIGNEAGGTKFVRWMPRLPKLAPGVHTVDGFVTMRADHWDGLGVDPAANLLPAGESLNLSVTFRVVRSRGD